MKLWAREEGKNRKLLNKQTKQQYIKEGKWKKIEKQLKEKKMQKHDSWSCDRKEGKKVELFNKQMNK